MADVFRGKAWEQIMRQRRGMQSGLKTKERNYAASHKKGSEYVPVAEKLFRPEVNFFWNKRHF